MIGSRIIHHTTYVKEDSFAHLTDAINTLIAETEDEADLFHIEWITAHPNAPVVILYWTPKPKPMNWRQGIAYVGTHDTTSTGD